MPGINLSQSAVLAEDGEKRVSASSKAVFGSLFLLIIAGVAYGVQWYFSYDLDKKQTAITQDIQKVRSGYISAPVFRVAKFFIKSEAAMTKRAYADIDPADELRVMNKNILPEVVLDSYENDFSTDTVKISGKTTAFFRVAQQMKVFRDSGNFSSVVLGGPVTRGEDGSITFSLSLVRMVDQKKN
jgi:hypothetical protein